MSAPLSSRFAHPDVRFTLRDRLTLIDIANAFGSATLTTFGGTLLSYVPAGGTDLLWVSDTAVYDGSKPVRGGVPVCWPWFGPWDAAAMGADASDAAKKAHGFARYETWEVESVDSRPGGATRVVLVLLPNASIARAWPHAFRLRLAVTLGEQLQVELTGENLSARDWVVSEALHTYFRVGEAEGLAIHGLEGCTFIDRSAGAQATQQRGALRLAPPLDCVYFDHRAPVAIDDAANRRTIEMTKSGSASTIVWNPGEVGAKSFADMPDDQFHAMVCVEAGNALDNRYTLKAGASHTLGMTLRARTAT